MYSHPQVIQKLSADELKQLNHYERLGLTREATEVELKKAYNKSALLYHPDKNLDGDTNSFHCIQEAYDTLRDATKKARYDLDLPSQGTVNHKVNKKGSIIGVSNKYVAIRIGEEIHVYDILLDTRHTIIKKGILYSDGMISERENLLYATHFNGIHVFSLETGELVNEFKINYSPVVIGKDDKGIYVKKGDSLIKINQQEKKLNEILVVKDAEKFILSFDNKYVIVLVCSVIFTSIYPKLCVYDLKTGKLFKKLDAPSYIWDAKMSSDGQFIAYGGDSSIVNLYDIQTDECHQIVVDEDKSNSARSLIFSPNNKYIVIAGTNNINSIYSIDEKRIVYRQKINPNLRPEPQRDIFLVKNRIITNCGREIYNMPVPLDLKFDSPLYEPIAASADAADVEILEKMVKGIGVYINTRDSKLGFFSKHFDDTRGKNRADIYTFILENKELSTRVKEIAAYSLLASFDGKNLQNTVVAKLNEGVDKNNHFSKKQFRLQLKEKVLEKKEMYSVATIDKVVADLVKYANSDDPLNKSKILAIFEKILSPGEVNVLKEQAQNQGPNLKASVGR